MKEKNTSKIETNKLIFFIEPYVVLGVMNLCIVVVVQGLTLLCCYLSNGLIVLCCDVSHGLMV